MRRQMSLPCEGPTATRTVPVLEMYRSWSSPESPSTAPLRMSTNSGLVYFEHAYLARYLGFTLVEGGDLMVRNRRVFIKTLDGLEPVDVIFRRLDDSFCDPLELRSDSSLGVAGLVEAARAGHVAIANALGSGVIETAAIMAFLPGLCRHLLGEDLMLPSVATWWCGQPKELQHVIEKLDRLVAKRTFPSQNREPMFGRKLTEREKAALAAEMRAHPNEFVGQDQVALSTAPVRIGQAWSRGPWFCGRTWRLPGAPMW